MYNILEEKLENNIRDVTFKKVTDNHLLYAGRSKNMHVFDASFRKIPECMSLKTPDFQ